MLALFKKIITLLILASFVMLLIFGIFTMIHSPDGQMLGECPFSFVGTANCIQNTLATAIHYLSSYQSFLNVTVDYGSMTLLVSLIIFAGLFSILFIDPNIFKLNSFIKRGSYDPPQISSEVRKIIRWLSLLENSPSPL
ncbi:MAG: hypothetical protein A3A96_03925 [Candidatus Zambryskibacteria bacterium RIFCSPLOWO2_01_FULL_39_39]|uniref:Uncharacterized protein n=2 Tax=Patescibacteria group TaxID=1783273 RepID=A0A0G0EJT9_9BACT|nr:MAG: hypothetical protein US19_C0049G0003 [Candidatus Daviesbacteria bacterium GW2011_GWB1_36_5]KKQ77740.1 MAG: hypothetical protein UT00_C0006G0042 [Parcubacteria group bacterium GW2011_GWA1_38_7]OHA87095.1 MAG: hypothetical protein A2644_03510 [Candidatus Zambryskibacteria bacterium RIFCSPHIGHO2_01_FULL_39_63]OHA94636.1 MAG: hypothetical protein A3B88_00315 [Candidatus Zambryskibacteria bacterium RIFCSPHIGHO2_02_FULL_39_19]OHA98087.1 MAG: hypothetical protein A3F20_01215 [Candidatus Zambry